MKLNYNKFLSNSKRSDVIGFNIYTRGLKAENNTSERLTDVTDKWDAPEPGLNGAIAIGYQIDKNDVLCPVFKINGNTVKLKVMRNYWTPAYMTTYYRTTPQGEYRKSGLYCIKETKYFTEDDTFISDVTVFNDDRDSAVVKVELTSSFDNIEDNVYRAQAKIMPGCLCADTYLDGFAASGFSNGDSINVCIEGNSSYSFRYGFAFSKASATEAIDRLRESLKISEGHLYAEKRFNKWIDDHAPIFETDDWDLMKVYYYRIFLIKHALHIPSDVLNEPVFTGECAYESPFGKWFGGPVGLPIPMQIEEMKWLRGNSAENQIKTWIRGEGCTHSYIQFTPYAIWKYCLQSGNTDIISDVYEACKEYTLQSKGENDDLPITRGSWVTGAEYQPSFYQHTTPAWDFRNDSGFEEEGFEKAKLHRLDEITMLTLNAKACAKMAEEVGKLNDSRYFKGLFESLTNTLENEFWVDSKSFFFDRDPKSGKLCDQSPSYVGIMPMLLDLKNEKYCGITDMFSSTSEFLCDFSLTSVAKSCPMYWFDNCITGPTIATKTDPHRYHCCWNGPVWPFAVSLALDGIGHSTASDTNASNVFSKIFSAYTELHFVDGDRTTPCIFEHYRPTDGMSFSPFADYFHSEWLNLLLKHWAGIHVCEEDVEFTPITTEEFTVKNVMLRGKIYNFSQKNENGKLIREITTNT